MNSELTLFNAPRTLVMGILNVTPDSFSDGGTYTTTREAVDGALHMVDEGADIIDIGGESTRPGASPLTAQEEWQRIGAVVQELAQRGVPISIDTYHSETVRRAVECGVQIINDVTGGAGDEKMFDTVATADCFYILQHSRGASANQSTYNDVAVDVAKELTQSRERAEKTGISREKIILDPGFGFAKDAAQCWDLARNMDTIKALGFPVLVGVSRKRFVREMTRGESMSDRDNVSALLAFHFAQQGVWAVRAHNVRATREAVDVAERLVR